MDRRVKPDRSSVFLVLGLMLLAGARAPAQEHGKLRIRIESPAGDGISGARVRIYPPGLGAPFVAEAASNRAGVVKFKNLPAGNYNLQVVADDFNSIEVPVVASPSSKEKTVVVLRFGPAGIAAGAQGRRGILCLGGGTFRIPADAEQ